jgi:hypothetical protein
MGFLKDMLNPVKHFQDTKRSVGALARGDIKGALDPAGLLIKPPAAAGGVGMSGPNAVQIGMDPSQFMGDESDPAFGSFSQPFDVEQFYNYADPGYAFELQQGTQALQNSAAAGSGAMSGAALKDLLGYSQNFARTGYGDAFNRYQTQQGNIFNRLRDIATIGQSAAAGVGTQGTALAGNAGQFLSNAGSAAGAGIVGAGNAASSGLTNYWLMQQFMKPQPVAGGTGGV